MALLGCQKGASALEAVARRHPYETSPRDPGRKVRPARPEAFC